MNLEREVKVAIDPGFRMPDLSAPGDGLRGEGDVIERYVSTYHDTADLRIVRWGASLRHRPHEGWTVKLPEQGSGTGLTRQEHTFDAPAGRPPAEAVDLVRALVRSAGVGPVARVQTVRRRAGPAGARRGGGGGRAPPRPVADVVDDEVSVLEGRRVVDRFREVEVEAVDGTDGAGDAALASIVDLVTVAGGEVADQVPKVVRALGDAAAGPPDVVVPSFDGPPTVEQVVRIAVASSVSRLIVHDPVVRVGVDPEGVHQARVATRRLRSDLRSFRALLDDDWRDGLRVDLGWLGSELGAVRDLDVLGERIREHAVLLSDDDAAQVRTVLERLRRSRERALSELTSAMREPRYVTLLDALVAAAAAPEVLAAVADRSADEAMGTVMERPWAHLQRHCDALGPRSTDAELHEARIRAKRVRYAAEALEPVFGKPARRFARKAASLQQVLGAHQDAVMAIAWLRAQAGGTTPKVAFTAGRLAGIDEGVRDEARAAWPDVWAALRPKRLRFWG